MLFSKKSDEWPTPQWIFDELNNDYSFTLDPAATPDNAKCDEYFTMEQDGLTQDWDGHTVFVNPPYSGCFNWVKKAHEQVKEGKADKVVMLIPARVDTKWFHLYCMDNKFVSEICFIKGRLKFGDQKNSAPFPSMIVVFEKNSGKTKMTTRANKPLNKLE